jgi:hypothetical protein
MADYPDPPIQDAEAPALRAKPAWAYFMKDAEYIPGDDLHSGDTIYLSKNAYPRVLWTQLSRTSWSVLVQMPDRHFRSQLAVNPAQHYVVKRATMR